MNIPTFCISLRKKDYKWKEILDRLNECGLVNSNIFEAVDGPSIKDELNQVGILSPWTYYKINNNIRRHYHCEIISWGAVGCYLSHYILWKQLLEDPDNDRYLILEDDFYLTKQSGDILRNLISNIPSDADFVFLDILWTHKQPSKYNELYDLLDCQFFGTHCYIVTKQGVQKIINYLFPIEVQIDAFISHFKLNKYLSRVPLNGIKKYEKSTIQVDSCLSCYPSVVSGGILYMHRTKILLVSVILVCFIGILLLYYNKNILTK